MQVDCCKLDPISILPTEIGKKCLGRPDVQISTLSQVARSWRELNNELWQARWRDYLNLPALKEYTGRINAEPDKWSALSRQVYDAVIKAVETTFAEAAFILKSSKIKYGNDAINPFRLAELATQVSERRDEVLIAFYTSLEWYFYFPNQSTSVRSYPLKEDYTTKLEFANAIRSWFAKEESQPYLMRITILTTGSIPPEIKYLKNLRELTVNNKFLINDFLIVPVELSECVNLRIITFQHPVRIKDVPIEVLEMTSSEEWFINGGNHPFYHFVVDQHYFLNQLVAEMDGQEPLRKTLLNKCKETYRMYLDNIILYKQWIESNKEKLANVVKIDLTEYGGLFFPKELDQLPNLQKLTLRALYFFHEIYNLKSLKELCYSFPYTASEFHWVRKFDKIEIKKFTIFENLEKLTIPSESMTYFSDLLALKNLKELKISNVYSFGIRNDVFPSDEFLDSSVEGIQYYLREDKNTSETIKKRLDDYRFIIRRIPNGDFCLNLLEASYSKQPGKLYLHMRRWIVQNKQYLWGFLEGLFHTSHYAKFKHEIEVIIGGKYDDAPHPSDPAIWMENSLPFSEENEFSSFFGVSKDKQGNDWLSKNEESLGEFLSMTETEILKTAPILRRTVSTDGGEQRPALIPQKSISTHPISERKKLIYRDWIQASSISKTKIVAGVIFTATVLSGISLYIVRSYVAKFIATTFIAIVAFNLLFKYTKQPRPNSILK